MSMAGRDSNIGTTPTMHGSRSVTASPELPGDHDLLQR